MVDSELYTAEYFQDRCGGVEFFHQFGYSVLKPALQQAVLAADLKPGQRLLDVGCGRGELVAHLSDKGFDVTGVDYSADAIDMAKKMYPKGRFLQMDVGDIDFTKQTFDRVFILGTIEHLTKAEIEKLMSNVKRILSPGGMVIATTCTNKLYYKVWSYRFRAALASFLRAFKIPVRNPLPPRSSDDQALHINEMAYFDLKSCFSKSPWICEIRPLPNAKVVADRLYEPDVLAKAPLRAASRWKQAVHRLFLSRFPLNLLFSRQYLVVLTVA